MTDHSRQAPRDIPELTADIEKQLLDLGYSPNQVQAFIAGAFIFGHLRPGGALWYVEHQIAHVLHPAHCRDDLLETAAARARVSTNKRGNPNRKPIE